MANAEKLWDRLASGWDKRTDLETPDSEVIVKTRPLLHAGDRVLDFGCAAGSVAIRLAPSVGSIHGIDVSSNMIAAAERWKQSRNPGNVTFAHATIFDSAIVPGSYDAVLAFAIFHLLDDTGKVLTRIRELLRPGGLLISVTPCVGAKASFGDRVLVIVARTLSLLRLIPRVRFLRVAELHEALAAAGLRVTASDPVALGSAEYFVVAERV
jgi:2-polyprenyl-3-methyl-5-hydroxy-6-metoxy-1,4-benzoquinol methylase